MASTSTSSTSSPDIDITAPSTSTFTHRNPWAPQTTHHENGQTPEPQPFTNGHITPSTSSSSASSPTSIESTNFTPAPLTLRSFLLGLSFGSSLLLTLYLSPFSLFFSPTNNNHHTTPLWRLPFFASSLSLFHYLEYQTTALYNPLAATDVSAFLLSQNGRAYNIAHGLAFAECAVRWYFFPDALQRLGNPSIRELWLAMGFIMMIVGQTVRTTAMAHAGANFSHVMRRKKEQGHVLVTGGIYKWLRHPSYFGFFWWGLGSQVVLGNIICLLGYAVVLWRFFRSRIEKEENSLISFFANDYIRYRDQTWVGIPFIK